MGWLVSAADLRARGVTQTTLLYTLVGQVYLTDETLGVARRLQARKLLAPDWLKRAIAHELAYRANRPTAPNDLPTWRAARRASAAALAREWLNALAAEPTERLTHNPRIETAPRRLTRLGTHIHRELPTAATDAVRLEELAHWWNQTEEDLAATVELPPSSCSTPPAPTRWGGIRSRGARR